MTYNGGSFSAQINNKRKYWMLRVRQQNCHRNAPRGSVCLKHRAVLWYAQLCMLVLQTSSTGPVCWVPLLLFVDRNVVLRPFVFNSSRRGSPLSLTLALIAAKYIQNVQGTYHTSEPRLFAVVGRLVALLFCSLLFVLEARFLDGHQLFVRLKI